MNTYNIFKILLNEAKKTEEEAINKICNLYNVRTIIRQDETNYKFIKYDFKTDDNKTYEVKHDKRAVNTNNVFIEYMQYGSPSGIDITEADHHIFKIGSNFYLIDTLILKQLIQDESIKKVSFKNIDGLTTKGYLLPLNIFKNNSIVLN
jgi:hypothetical protein